MSNGAYLYVKNWDELQHYTKRNPPWIKLYRRLLKEGDFQKLSEAHQWQLVRIWLVSAEEHPGGWVSGSQRWLKTMIGTQKQIPVSMFIAQGWLTSHSEAEYASAVASTIASTQASADAINHGAKDPPKLPPRGTEIHKEPSFLPTSTTDGKEGGSQNGQTNQLPDLTTVLKEMPA